MATARLFFSDGVCPPDLEYTPPKKIQNEKKKKKKNPKLHMMNRTGSVTHRPHYYPSPTSELLHIVCLPSQRIMFCAFLKNYFFFRNLLCLLDSLGHFLYKIFTLYISLDIGRLDLID